MVAMVAPVGTVWPSATSQAGHGARLVGGDVVLHLHGLQDDQGLARP